MSAKTSTQPGRRTPLSLSGSVTKTHQNKGGSSNAAGNNANGHTTSNANKQDNKLQQSKTEQQQTVNNADTKENPNKKQQQQADKKQQQNENNKKSNDKNQNGVNSNKQQQANENKQQQQNKDKQQQQQNGNENKINEKEKKEKSDKANKTDKSEKQQDKVEKIEKVDSKIKEDKVEEDKKQEQEKPDTKKEEKQSKEVKETKEDKKESVAESKEKAEPQQQVKNDEKKSKDENQIKNSDQKPKENIENMDVVEEQQQQSSQQQKSPPVTPKTNNSKANKTSTPVNKTPTKATEKTPQKSTPSKNTVKTTPTTKREVTTAIDNDNDDVEMEPLAIESSPIKSLETEEVAHMNIAPSATSTPGKILLPKRNVAAPKSDVQLAMQSGISPERPRAFSQISGRKSIRPISDYTPSKFQCNPQFRESYRRINTELDVTNTSMNVTVGSEVPNNLSFSFFGRGRKRDRTPPQHSQSAIGELQTDMEISPPKRARLDMNGFFSAVSSPLSLLRNRFSKATLQSSTPVKLQEKLSAAEDEIEVQNVSGVSVHEEIGKTDKETTETNAPNANDDNDATLGEEAKETKLKTDIETPTSAQGDSEGKEFTDVSLKTCGMEQSCEQSDIKITETPLQSAVGDPMAKNKRCIVM